MPYHSNKKLAVQYNKKGNFIKFFLLKMKTADYSDHDHFVDLIFSTKKFFIQIYFIRIEL